MVYDITNKLGTEGLTEPTRKVMPSTEVDMVLTEITNPEESRCISAQMIDLMHGFSIYTLFDCDSSIYKMIRMFSDTLSNTIT